MTRIRSRGSATISEVEGTVAAAVVEVAAEVEAAETGPEGPEVSSFLVSLIFRAFNRIWLWKNHYNS